MEKYFSVVLDQIAIGPEYTDEALFGVVPSIV